MQGLESGQTSSVCRGGTHWLVGAHSMHVRLVLALPTGMLAQCTAGIAAPGDLSQTQASVTQLTRGHVRLG
jgi:hypothetical protein